MFFLCKQRKQRPDDSFAPQWHVVEAQDAYEAFCKLKDRDPKLDMDDLIVEGPHERKQADFIAYDRRSHPEFTVKAIIRKLICLIEQDPHVSFSSKMVLPPAHHALLAWAYNPYVKDQLIRTLVSDIRHGTAGWNHITMLFSLSKDPFVVSDDMKGSFDKFCKAWAKWGDENGYKEENLGDGTLRADKDRSVGG